MPFQNDVLTEFKTVFSRDRVKTAVFYVEIDDLWDDDYQFEVALRLLPFQQQTKIIQKKFSSDAKTTLANQLLQRFISCLCLGTTDQSDLQFKQNQYGKPYLVGSNFSYSMSNQQGYSSMVVSLDGSDIGIDLASCSDVDKFGEDYLKHFKDIFHKHELEYLEGFTKEEELKLVFTEYWALKESYTKNLGVGLNGDLASYNFHQVPIIKSISSKTPQSTDLFEIRDDSQWYNSTKLSINNHLQDLDIYLAMLNPDIVVSVCGQIPENPQIIRIPLTTLVKFLQ